MDKLTNSIIHYKEFIIKNFSDLNEIDSQSILNMRNHINIRKWMNTDHQIYFDEHNKFIHNLKTDSKNYYYLIQAQNDVNLGVISLTRVDFKNQNAYLGIYTNAELQGTGAGSKCMDVLTYLAFKIGLLHTLKLEVLETNERAIHLYQKCGFVDEGRLKEYINKDGHFLDMIIMGKINDEN